jgi:3-hydroxyisobutyrate dehydrogenase
VSAEIRSVAVLGTGAMGSRMAVNLVQAGFEVRAWDPDRGRADAVDGATAFETAAAAAGDADVVLTMAPDGPAVARTMFGEGAVAEAMRPDGLWLQTSTIGVRWATDFAERGLLLVDAPVIGTLPEAEGGRLYFFASGPEQARPLAQRIFDVLGARTYWYDRPGDGQRMKLCVNGWLLTLLELAAESLALVEGLGLDPRQLMEILDGHPVGSPLLQNAGSAMLEGRFEGGLRLALAHKDLGLVGEAAEEAGIELALAPAARTKMADALELASENAGTTATFLATRRTERSRA